MTTYRIGESISGWWFQCRRRPRAQDQGRRRSSRRNPREDTRTEGDLMTDLDLAASIIDDARHAMSPEKPGPRIEPTKRVLWSEDASRIVREWEDRKRRVADPTPAHVRHHLNETYRIADSEVRL